MKTQRRKLYNKRTGPKPGSFNPREMGAGRQKGTPNLVTRDVKEAIIEAAHRIGGKDGLVGYFMSLHRKRPEVFAGVIARIIPTSVSVKTDITAMILQKLQQPSTQRPMLDVTPNRTLEHVNEHNRQFIK